MFKKSINKRKCEQSTPELLYNMLNMSKYFLMADAQNSLSQSVKVCGANKNEN